MKNFHTAEYRNFNNMQSMKNKIFTGIAACLAAVSCNVQEIPYYKAEDSALNFEAGTVAFSVRGINDEEIDLSINLELIGVVTDYDRPITVEVSYDERNTAIENEDFFIREALVRAGETYGEINMTVKKLPIDVDERTTTMRLVPNEYFRAGEKGLQSAIVSWSASYVRPPKGTWRSWWNFFCRGYSKAYHELLIEVFGEGIERYAHIKSDVTENPELEYKLIDWWYSANRELRKYVEEYDATHPDAPLMHSSDYEVYEAFTDPVGTGTKPAVIPTIYETLLSY